MNARAYRKDLVKACKEATDAAFDKLNKKWNIAEPTQGWLPDARQIMMHKFRINELAEYFSEEEKETSRKWLTDNGYSLNTYEMGPRTKALEGKGN